MMRSSLNASMWSRIFLILFALSAIVLLVLWFSGPVVGDVFTEVRESLDPNSTQPTPVPSTSRQEFFTVVGMAVTSVTSLVGFIITTVIGWRKEKREAALADVERRKLEVDLEKSRLELEKLKGSKPKRKVKK